MTMDRAHFLLFVVPRTIHSWVFMMAAIDEPMLYIVRGRLGFSPKV